MNKLKIYGHFRGRNFLLSNNAELSNDWHGQKIRFEWTLRKGQNKNNQSFDIFQVVGNDSW